jgi:hypothetical protein
MGREQHGSSLHAVPPTLVSRRRLALDRDLVLLDLHPRQATFVYAVIFLDDVPLSCTT